MVTTTGLVRMTARLAGAALLLASVLAGAARAEEAKELYKKRCATCHGEQGKGDGPVGQKLQPRAADFATALDGKDDAYIAKVIRGGGASVGKAKVMPAFGTLKDAEVEGLVGYVKGLTGR